MNKKNEIINKLRAARVSHTTWKSYAHLIAKGVLSDANGKATPLVPTLCDFGKWYYTDGMILSSLKSYKDVEFPHEQLHKIYAQIYSLKSEVLKSGFFTSKSKVLKKRQNEIDELLKSLDDYVLILLSVLKRLEEEVEHMTDTEILSLH